MIEERRKKKGEEKDRKKYTENQEIKTKRGKRKFCQNWKDNE